MRLEPETIARRLSDALAGTGLRWVDLRAHPHGGIQAGLAGEGGAVLAKVRALSRAKAPNAEMDSSPVDGVLMLEAPVEALQRAVRLALRAGAVRRELGVRQAAVERARLPHRAVTAPAPARVIYHGRPSTALLPIERALGAVGVRFHATLTPVSTLDALHEGGVDGLLLDATPGRARALSILNALRRNAKSAGLPAYLLARSADPDLSVEAAERGARGVWGHGEARDPPFAGWLIDALTRARAERCASAHLEAIADAGMLASASAQAYRAAHLDFALKAHRQMRLLAFACRRAQDMPVRGPVAVGLVRRVVRSVDAVFWREPDCLVIGLANADEALARLVALRARLILPNAGFTVTTQANVTSHPGELGEALLRRLEGARARANAQL